MTLSELTQQRQAVGAAYRQAAQAFIDAWTELHAHDIALSSGLVGGGQQLGFGEQPHPPGHGEFLRNSIHGDLASRASNRSIELVKAFCA